MKSALALLLLSLCLAAVAAAQDNPTKSFAATATYPQIVAKVSLTGKTATIPATNILTPATSGTYRLSVYWTETVANSASGPWQLVLAWSDEVGPETTGQGPSYLLLYPGSFPPFAFVQQSLIVRAAAGVPITYSVVGYAGGTPSGTYDLYIVAEKLM